MKKLINRFLLLSLTGLIIFSILYICLNNVIYFSLAITSGTIFYHFYVRVIVAVICNKIIPTKINENNIWFAQKRFEKPLYDIIKLKKWKHFVPTYNKTEFDVNNLSYDELIRNMCKAEIGHEIMILLSFVPLLFAIPFGEFRVFLITSTFAAVLDLACVMLQRYNRPRLEKFKKIKLLNKTKKEHI